MIKFFIGILIFVLIVDPGDLIFRLKTPLFLLIFALWFCLKTISPIKINRDIWVISFVFGVIPLVGVCIALAQDNFADAVFALGFIKSFSIIILLIIVVDLELITDKYLLKYSLIIPLIIIPVYFLLIVNPNLAFSIITYLSDKDVAKFSNRDFYGYKVVMLYYRTSPLLVFPLAYYCHNLFFKKESKFISFVLVVLFFSTLLLSGTRANMLVAVLIAIYFVFSYLISKRNKLPLIISTFLLAFAFFAFVSTLSFSKADESSNVKSGHVDSYKVLFNNNPQYLLWGQGLGGQFYSTGNGTVVSQTELTYFDLVRWFGIPLTIVIFFLLIYPLCYLYLNNLVIKSNRYSIAAYMGYLFIAGTNPLLVSSTGMLVIIIMYSFVKQKEVLQLR